MEGSENNYHIDDELNIGSYCFCDDDEYSFCVILDITEKTNQYTIIDFQENRERIVVKSSLQKIRSLQHIEQARNLHDKYSATQVALEYAEIEANKIQQPVEKRKKISPEQIKCRLIILFWIIATIGPILIIIGVAIHDASSEYAKYGTKEQCLITRYDLMQCSYQCNCDALTETCEICDDGQTIIYSATVENKCSTVYIFNNVDDFNCRPVWDEYTYDIGESYSCYTMDCKEGRFSFIDYGNSIRISYILFITGSVVFVVCGCIALVLCFKIGLINVKRDIITY